MPDTEPKSVVRYYATSDGQTTHDYKFEFRRMPDDSWRAYVLKIPDFGGEWAFLRWETHVIVDNDGKYVCWDRPVRSLEDVMAVAAAWADATQRYYATGKPF